MRYVKCSIFLGFVKWQARRKENCYGAKKGIILDCLCVLLGTNLGSAIKNHIPARINQPMNVIFGLSAIAIGITSVVKLHSLPAVILAFILGGLIGEAVNLDDKSNRSFSGFWRGCGSKFTATKKFICAFT